MYINDNVDLSNFSIRKKPLIQCINVSSKIFAQIFIELKTTPNQTMNSKKPGPQKYHQAKTLL